MTEKCDMDVRFLDAVASLCDCHHLAQLMDAWNVLQKISKKGMLIIGCIEDVNNIITRVFDEMNIDCFPSDTNPLTLMSFIKPHIERLKETLIRNRVCWACDSVRCEPVPSKNPGLMCIDERAWKEKQSISETGVVSHNNCRFWKEAKFPFPRSWFW